MESPGEAQTLQQSEREQKSIRQNRPCHIASSSAWSFLQFCAVRPAATAAPWSGRAPHTCVRQMGFLGCYHKMITKDSSKRIDGSILREVGQVVAPRQPRPVVMPVSNDCNPICVCDCDRSHSALSVVAACAYPMFHAARQRHMRRVVAPVRDRCTGASACTRW